ncbi:MAG: putative porin [Candidatus Magnetomorum sp.]|nr:putative porin [Candidatus Magnetomorum sp.]
MVKIIKITLIFVCSVFLFQGISFADINLKLGKNIDELRLKGDLRVRFERHDEDKDANDAAAENNPKDRFRTRFRLGMFWKNPEDWEIGAGFCTGGSSSSSTNDTWSDDNSYFDSGDIRLDYAYAKHKMNAFTLIAGQQKNPFKTSWLLWDSDIRPAGFTAQVDIANVFGTFGAYDVIQNGNDIGMMFALQGGASIKAGNISMLGTLTGYVFNSHVPKPNKDYDYQIIDLYGTINIELDKKVSLSPYLQVFNNTGADGKEGEGNSGGDLDPSSENWGWVLGVDGKIFDGSFKLAYAQIGADSCVPDLKNADFGSKLTDGVNVQGVMVAGGYKITKHCGVEATAYLYEPLEDVVKGTKDNRNMQLYHLDLKYKF